MMFNGSETKMNRLCISVLFVAAALAEIFTMRRRQTINSTGQN